MRGRIINCDTCNSKNTTKSGATMYRCCNCGSIFNPLSEFYGMFRE